MGECFQDHEVFLLRVEAGLDVLGVIILSWTTNRTPNRELFPHRLPHLDLTHLCEDDLTAVLHNCLSSPLLPLPDIRSTEERLSAFHTLVIISGEALDGYSADIILVATPSSWLVRMSDKLAEEFSLIVSGSFGVYRI